MQSSWISCAKSDCSMSQYRTAHSQILRLMSHCVRTIPQSAKLTAPFTQRGLWCSAPPEVLWKLATAQQRETDCHTSDVGHWFAMTRWKMEGAVREPLSQRLRPLTAPLTGEPLMGGHFRLP